MTDHSRDRKCPMLAFPDSLLRDPPLPEGLDVERLHAAMRAAVGAALAQETAS